MLLGADKITVLKNLYKAIEDVVGSGGEEVGIILEAIEELNTKVEALEVATENITSLSDKVEALETGMANLSGLPDSVEALETSMTNLSGLSGYKVGSGEDDIPTVSAVEVMIGEAIDAISGGE